MSPSVIYNYTETAPKRIFVCSGGSGSFIDKAIDEECDMFILGEVSERLIADTKENRM
jgi:putative NIF3 family GTP cyclohydrolase 1 type 2